MADASTDKAEESARDSLHVAMGLGGAPDSALSRPFRSTVEKRLGGVGRHRARRTRVSVVWLTLALTVIGATLILSARQVSGSGRPVVPMVGTFAITPGRCNDKTYTVSGSYFRLIFPGGSLTKGPFFNNANSRCTTKSFTLLKPGTDGGLSTGIYQPDPQPAFSKKGNALANVIVRPVSFTGPSLSVATNPTDRQSKRRVPQPSIVVRAGGVLSGQLQAVSVAWNHLYFNQGSPKPGGPMLGSTQPVTGTYNQRTHAFALSWTSQIMGGQFNQFIGYWHLAGTFHPSGGPPVVPSGPPATPTTNGTVGSSPGTTTSTKPPNKQSTTSTTAAKGTTSTNAPANPLLSDVYLVNCAAVNGGWSAGGVARNTTGTAASYQIKIAFTSPSGATLATSTGSVTIPANGTNLWSTSATFTAPSGTRCVVKNVTAG